MFALMNVILRPIFDLYRQLTLATFGRDIASEWKLQKPVWRVISAFFLALLFLITAKQAWDTFFGQVSQLDPQLQIVNGGSEGVEEDYRNRSSASKAVAPMPDVQLVDPERIEFGPDGSLSASFEVATPGRIVGWQMYFAFTTPCENDHYAELRSPEGRRLIVMNRGLNRCSGTAATFSSFNDDDAGAFVGGSSEGTWTFTMKDLDRNSMAASLDAFWMTLQLEANGTTTPLTVRLEDLPKDIPEPR